MPSLEVFTTTEADPRLLGEIRLLLMRAFAGDFSDDDWEHAIGGWHVTAMEHGSVASHAAVVPRVLEVAGVSLPAGYVEGVATAPARQRTGLGSLVMAGVADVLQSELAMGALSTGLHDFYERHGWERWQGPTFVRDGAETIRTEEEDDGVMVLRFGASRGIDRTAPLTCEARRGDDW